MLYYKDMQSLAVSPNPQPGKMYFRVPRRLVHFAADYDPIKHYVVLYFSSSSTLQTIRSDIMPLINGATANEVGGSQSSLMSTGKTTATSSSSSSSSTMSTGAVPVIGKSAFRR